MGGEDVEATLQSLEVTTPDELLAGTDYQFKLMGTFSDGTTRDVSDMAEWASTNEELVSFTGGGAAELPYGGNEVTVSATIGDLSAEMTTNVACDYPRFPANIRLGQAVAAVRWDPAYRENNTATHFDFREAHCFAEYKDINAFIIIVNAVWCQPCIQEIRRVGPRAQALLDAGGLVLYVTIQDANYGPIAADAVNDHINRLVGADSPGVRMGSIGADPEQFFNNNAIIQAFPTAFVIRKSDMEVIADSRALNYHLDPYFGAILDDLAADWSNPSATAPLPFDNNCSEGDEEDSEPNDTAAQAAPLAPGTHDAGICTAEPDFYRVEAEGSWTVRVEFAAATGDIDMALWDTQTDMVARVNGQPAVSQGTGNTEQIQSSGPGVVAVFGYAGASAPYAITLEVD